tara:strand:+ start:38497 stop:39735 length:1239 start_codon:yes stop_codon:yes gene_type:complete
VRSVLLIAPHNSYRIHAYIEAAQRLDIALVIASQSEFSLVSAVANGIQIDFSDMALSLQRIVTAHQEHQFSAVIASDDGSVALVALVGKTLGLSANAEDSAELTRRKDLARLRLKQHGQSIPGFRVINTSLPLLDQLSQLDYPVVVKPVSMSGSKGVIKANNEQECIAAVERIKPLLSQLANEEERTTILIEEFLDGPEVAYEGLLHKGRLRQLTIFDKPEPMNGPFFEESYYISPSRHSVSWQKIIHQRVSEACVAYGLTEGPIHAELRLIDKDAYIIEIAARTIGGDCADMLKFGLNIGLEELVLLQAMGKPIDIPEMKNSVGVLMIPIPEQGILRRVEGIEKAKKINGITNIGISVREGYELLPLPEGSSYLGFIFAKAPTQHLVESALRAAQACLNVVIAPSFKVQLG